MSGARLKLDDTFYFDEVRVYGLVSDLPHYRLCYFINNSLGLCLNRAKFDKKFVHKETLLNYALFEYEDESLGLHWSLTANKNPWAGNEDSKASEAYIISGLPLVPALKAIDFFLMIEGEISPAQERKWLAILRDMPQVRALNTIDLETKNIHHLLPN